MIRARLDRMGKKVTTRRSSARFRQAAMENLSLARLKSPWLRPWRCPSETDLIRRLAWQWEHKRQKYGFGECSKRGLARRLGVSQTWVQKLCREYRRDPQRLQTIAARQGVACIEQLAQAQEQTRQLRGRGQLRRRIRWPWAKRIRAERKAYQDWRY